MTLLESRNFLSTDNTNKAFVYVENADNRLANFLSDKSYANYQILAILTKPMYREKIIAFLDKNHYALKVTSPELINAETYNDIDAVFVLDNSNFNLLFNQLVGLGLEPRKFILWSEDGKVNSIQAQQSDGTRILYMEGLELHIKNQDDIEFANEIHTMLQRQKIYANFTDAQNEMWCKQLYNYGGRKLNLSSPQKFTEKIQWLKLNEPSELKSRLADKYAVHEWTANKIGESHLVPLLGVWDNFDDINFDFLPNQFVLKCNHGCGMNIIVKDKSTFDMQQAKERINAWLKIEHGLQFFEPHYNSIKHKIIAEKYIESIDDELIDYKVHCFNGIPKFIQVIGRNALEHTGHQNNYDFNWQDIGWTFADYPDFVNPPPKPLCLDEMYKLAMTLSEDIPYVRIDFYVIDNHVVLGEMTFTPAGGYYIYRDRFTEDVDFKLGQMLDLSVVNKSTQKRGGVVNKSSDNAIYIGADFIPTASNASFFAQGNLNELIGSELQSILATSQFNIFNLELPLTNTASPIEKSGPAMIGAPEAINTYVQFKPMLLTLANNHILDQSEQGVQSTLNLLNRAQIPYCGAGMSLSTAKQPFAVRIGNKVIGIYACAEHECTIAGVNSAGANPFDPLESYDAVAELKQNCHHVIVLYHGGAEEYRYPSPMLQRYCRKFIEKGASLVICQHSHCVGCREDYLNGTIIYGQGNFLFNINEDNEYFNNGLLLKVVIDDNLRVEEIPIEKYGVGVRLANPESGHKILEGYRQRSEQIKIPGFIESNYERFAAERVSWYLSFYYLNYLPTFLNGLPKHNYVDILNNTRCEAHHELFMTGLKYLSRR